VSFRRGGGVGGDLPEGLVPIEKEELELSVDRGST